MKAVQFDTFGAAQDVARIVDFPEPEPPQVGEVLVDVEAFPIHPVDLLTIAGGYATRPPLPAVPGSEALGRVVAVGGRGDRICVLAATSRQNALQLNYRMATNNGVSIEEICEALFQVAVYAGYAAAWDALVNLEEVLAAEAQ